MFSSHQTNLNNFRMFCAIFSQAYIIIDALDESTERKKTLNWVKKVISDTNRRATNLHLVVTSRPESRGAKVLLVRVRKGDEPEGKGPGSRHLKSQSTTINDDNNSSHNDGHPQ